jgi:hypothetical protein
MKNRNQSDPIKVAGSYCAPHLLGGIHQQPAY